MGKEFFEPVVEVIFFTIDDVVTTSAALHDVGDVDWSIDKPKSEQ